MSNLPIELEYNSNLIRASLLALGIVDFYAYYSGYPVVDLFRMGRIKRIIKSLELKK